ncbi:pyridoxamine 5-phosphate oxidase [Gigaspora margarita]|uniref:Pyridoxamine 5-phosphate oxidase n=3 Tax=Gigaspora margarita TaxID=4874 RepID=A0A8H4ESD0_GIGMA|nr:pyridoxamine 5-phosphate oxidase [Gigaspora margarita]
MTDTTTPWTQLIQQSHKKNYRNVVYVQMTNLRRNGQPSLHNIRFLDFLKDDNRYLIFPMAFNDNNLHGDVKSNPTAQLSWQMQTTEEIYNLSGRFYITSSPARITRFPAPKIITSKKSLTGTDEISPKEYWESLRRQFWSSLSSQNRAIYTWPPPGETPKSDKKAFECLKLDDMLDVASESNNPDKVLHDSAFDNFCLLVFKVNEVVRFEYGVFPAKRIVYRLDDEEKEWIVEESNP